MKSFLSDEISYQEMYDEIIWFINSYEIKNGEFEANSHVIRKIDNNNFIISSELVDNNNMRHIGDLEVYNKDNLIKMINEHAKNQNLNIRN